MRSTYTILGVILIVSLMTITAAAAEKPSRGQTFWRGVINYPVKATEEAANVVADTGKKTTKVVADEVETAGKVMTGDMEKTKDLVVEPMVGTATTVKETAEDTVKLPVVAAEQASEAASQ